MSNTRQEGYYWVKHQTNTSWSMASYYEGRWCIHDSARDEYGYDFTDEDFGKINETRILSPDEQIKNMRILDTLLDLINQRQPFTFDGANEIKVQPKIENITVIAAFNSPDESKPDSRFTELRQRALDNPVSFKISLAEQEKLEPVYTQYLRNGGVYLLDEWLRRYPNFDTTPIKGIEPLDHPNK